MPFTQKSLRYAHAEGRTNVCYSDDGRYIVTCGSEGDVRIYKGFDDEEPADQCVGDKAYAVVVKGDKMYIGTSNNYVKEFTFPESQLHGIFTRFKAPVTSIGASLEKNVIACGSQDMEVHISVKNSDATLLTIHKAPVLAVAVDPKGEFVASASCDGTVQVWRVGDENTLIRSWNCLPKSNSVETSPSLCKISWTPVSGQHLAIPCKAEVLLYERNSWENAMALTVPQLEQQELFSVSSFSHCGKYLAVSTTNKKIIVWNVKIGDVEFMVEAAGICDIAWQPQFSDPYKMAFCNTDGYLGLIEFTPADPNAEKKIHEEMSNDRMSLNEDDFNVPFIDDDEDNENAVSVDKIKAELGFNPDGSMIEKDERGRSRSRSASRSLSRSRSRSRSPPSLLPQVSMQQPFQPSSTSTALDIRFMVWNEVGIVIQYKNENPSISVKFHDASFHYPIRISNELEYSMAALSVDAVVYANEKIDGKPSHFGCTPLTKGTDWFVQLPENEEAVGVAAGTGWVAVATDMQMLRIFTICGNQREVITLPGVVVCLNGYKDILAAAFHISPGIGGSQWLGYSILQIRSSDICRTIASSQPLPLTPASTLTWMGFSDYGALCTTDSSGFVRLLASNQSWHPICNTRQFAKGVSDTYFVLGVNECLQTIKVVFCKGSEYPVAFPPPHMSEIPWRLPMCTSLEERGKLEEELWRAKFANSCLNLDRTDFDNSSLREAQRKNTIEINRSAIKLFSIACMENYNSKAFELCQLSASTHLIERAMQYAHTQNKVELAEQISELLTQMREDEANGVADMAYQDSRYMTPDLSRSIARGSFENSFNLQPVYHSTNNEPENDNLSQDMFADSQPKPETATNVPKKRLTPYGGRSSVTKDEVSQIRRRASLNPFKKDPVKTEPLRSTPVTTKANKTLPGILSNKKKAGKENSSVKEDTSISTEALPFNEWFKIEKDNFINDNPTMPMAQITKIALKKYKQLKSTGAIIKKTDNVEEPVTPITNSSDMEVSENISIQNDINETNDETTAEIIKEKEHTPVQEKKRKQPDVPHEATPHPKKAIKAASKLTGFFHKK